MNSQVTIEGYVLTVYPDGVISIYNTNTCESNRLADTPILRALINECIRLHRFEKSIMDVAEYHYATYHKHETSTQRPAISARRT